MRDPLRRTLAGCLFSLMACTDADAVTAVGTTAESADVAASSSSLPSPATAASLYGELGGREGVAAIVRGFFELMLSDERVKRTFDGVDLDHLRMRLAEQICSISGGGCKYGGRSMAEAHEDFHVGNAEFNASIENLQASMRRQGVPSRVQNRLLAQMAPMQRDIVTK